MELPAGTFDSIGAVLNGAGEKGSVKLSSQLPTSICLMGE